MAIGAAVAGLAEDPVRADFIRAKCHRLRVGAYRAIYAVEGDLRHWKTSPGRLSLD